MPRVVSGSSALQGEGGEGLIGHIGGWCDTYFPCIHTHAHRYGCKVCAVYGGAGKWEMQKALKEGPEIVVATPGRMIEMIKLKATNMRRCTMMVRRRRAPCVFWFYGGGGSLYVCLKSALARGARLSYSVTGGAQ